ncbi:GumC family protein [Brevundimonas sp.]|uniref:GumC family protein n=1 Tax=Brevundimonas sp. TaxID=1871086 RepID=UPI003B00193E
MRSTAYVTARPRYGVLDVIGLLFRELLLMILVFVVILGLGFAAAMTLKKTYTATGSVFAGVGQEYVYQPRVGTAERGQAPQGDEVANSEAAILGSSAVRQKVVQALGPAAILGETPKGGPERAQAAASKAIGSSLGVATAPGSAVIHLTYKADDPERAARVLNAVIEQYLIYRREVFQDKTPAIASQRVAFEDELGDADRAYETFLTSNQIGDFAAAKATLAATYQSVFTDRMSTQSQLNQTSQRLNTLVAQQAGTPAEVALQQDLNISAQDQVLQLRTEREQLLSRYQPDAQPVKDIEARINQLQAYVSTGTAVGAKEVRTGPKPRLDRAGDQPHQHARRAGFAGGASVGPGSSVERYSRPSGASDGAGIREHHPGRQSRGSQRLDPRVPAARDAEPGRQRPSRGGRRQCHRHRTRPAALDGQEPENPAAGGGLPVRGFHGPVRGSVAGVHAAGLQHAGLGRSDAGHAGPGRRAGEGGLTTAVLG